LFEIQLTAEAVKNLDLLRNNASQSACYKALKKTILLLANSPRHNSLQTHEFLSFKGLNGEKVFEAYAQQKTPAAYRVFYYGPCRNAITILAITAHP
jgi:hypothetical protein